MLAKYCFMNTALTPEITEVLEAVHYRPAVSLILPFEPKMGLKTELAYLLKMAARKVELQLKENYPEETINLVMQKLQAIINAVNYNTLKKSIAIYVSPVFEKILYLDLAVEEKIIVDESFEIRDLIYSKKQLHKYLLLLLNANESRIYLGNSATFVRLVSNSSKSVVNGNDAPERVANFSDTAERKEILMDKFLHHVDNGLAIILNAYPLPLFVLGTDRILGHFKKLTKHRAAVIDYIQGNYEEATTDQLKKNLEPYIANWQNVKQKAILNNLEEAGAYKKLATGIEEVWQQAMQLKGRLLVVEKNYMYAAQHGGSEDIIYKAATPFNKFSYIKDAVDDVIEKVLENGGDVEFVDEGVLKDFNQIALIQYY